jgi:hypothetical protein
LVPARMIRHTILDLSKKTEPMAPSLFTPIAEIICINYSP